MSRIKVSRHYQSGYPAEHGAASSVFFGMRYPMRTIQAITVTLAVSCVLTGACMDQAFAGPQKSFTETFDNTTYRNGSTTTAGWIGDGQLRLFPFVHTLVGSNVSVTAPYDVAVDGDHAFVADGFDGLRVLDITDPANPLIVGNWSVERTCIAVDVSGDIAALCFSDGGFRLADVSNPTFPTLIDSSPIGGYRDVKIVGTRAYTTTSNSMVIWDLSALPTLTQLGSYSLASGAEGIDVEGNFAYIAQGAQVTSINVSDPTTPIGWASIGGFVDATGIDVHGNVAYIGDQGKGVVTLDVSNPGAFVYGSVVAGGAPSRLHATGDHLYVAAGTTGLTTYNISDPMNPSFVASLDTPGTARGIVASGRNAFVADGSGGFHSVAIAALAANFSLEGGEVVTGGYAESVAQEGNIAIVGQGMDGFAIVSIENPNAPVVLANGEAEAYGVAIQGDFAYVRGTPLFSVYDISNTSNPVLLGSLSEFSESDFVPLVVEGGYAYITNSIFGNWGLNIIDISDPANPLEVGSGFVSFGTVKDIVLAGEYAFLATNDGLVVVEISDPLAPFRIQEVSPAGLNSIVIAGNYAYCTRGNAEIAVFDITDPTAVTHLATEEDLWTGATGQSLDIEGNYLYGADSTIGLSAVNPTD